MKSSPTLVGPLLQGFFVEHLRQQKHVNPQTIARYRDAFRLLFNMSKNSGISNRRRLM